MSFVVPPSIASAASLLIPLAKICIAAIFLLAKDGKRFMSMSPYNMGECQTHTKHIQNSRVAG